MMFDNSQNGQESKRSELASHIALAVVVGGAFAAGIGMHFASLTLVGLGVGHLLLGAGAMWFRSVRAKRKTGVNS